MQISSLNTYSSLQVKEHTAGCLCPACCKKEGSDKLHNASNVNENEEKEKATLHKSESELSSNERQQVTELRQIDSAVRAHEAAHMAAGGSVISGGASYTYQKGPDGQLYAIGGEVPISSSGGSTPESKIAIAKEIQAAALAPANPSPQDLKVAASAVQMEAQANQELREQKSEEQKDKELETYSNNQEEISTVQESSNLDLSA